MIYFSSHETFLMLLAMLAFGGVFLVFEIGLSLFLNILSSCLYFLKAAYNGKVKFFEIELKFKVEPCILHP